MPENLTTKELAAYLRLESERTLLRWRQQRIGPPWVKAGHKVLYRRADVDSWLERHRCDPVREVA